MQRTPKPDRIVRPKRKICWGLSPLRSLLGECLDEPRFLCVHAFLDHMLMKSWLSPVFLHLPHLSTFISPPSVFYSWGLEVGTGDVTEQPTSSDYISAGGPVLDPRFSSVWCVFNFPTSHSYSVTAGKAVKRFGKLKLDLPQPLLGFFSPENLYLKEAVPCTFTLQVYICYLVFVSITFRTHIYANG